jgi:hypothetical protein
VNRYDEPTRPLTPAGGTPTGGRRSAWIAAAVAALMAILGTAVLVVVLRSDDENADDSAVVIAADIERPIERLDDASGEATPRDRASMVTLRAAADRTVEELDDADDAIRQLDPDDQRAPAVQALDDSVDATRELAQALAAPHLSAAEIQGLAAAVDAAANDAVDAGLPAVDTASLVAELRGEARRRRVARRRSREQDSPAPAVDPPPAPPAIAQASFRQHSAYGYQAQIPTGSGWAEPADSQPTPGRLFRTSIRGPAGTFVIIDYTPVEAAGFGGSYQSRTEVGQTAFGQATEYVFQGGRLPECQRAPCVDYIINDPASDSGFAVLAGGSDFTSAKEIARTVMESLVPESYGE